MRAASLAAMLLFLAQPAGAQEFVIAVCNGGKIAFDAFAVVDAPPAVVHIAPDACEKVSTRNRNDAATVGFAFTDAKGQWGAPHRYDFMPSLPAGVLARANQSVSVLRGNQTVTAAAQFTLRPEGPICRRVAAGDNAADIVRNTQNNVYETICEGRYYELIVAAYADTHELSFRSDCERCPALHALSQEEQEADAVRQILESARTTKEATPRKRPDFTPYLQYWPEFTPALTAAGASGGLPPGVPRVIIVRGTVSRIEEAAPNASEHWIDIFFKEAPDGRFDVCSLGPEIFSEAYGTDFRTTLIGQTIEVEGEIERAYCKGFKGNIRVTLAHQARRTDATQLAAAMIAPARPPVAPRPVAPVPDKPYRDPSMPNYDISEDAAARQVQQHCTGLYDPVMKTAQQQEVRNANVATVRQEIERCRSNFDPVEVRDHRRLAMRYCLGHNNFTERTSGVLPAAYDTCMEKNDTLTALCDLELNFRQRSYAVSARAVEQHCTNVRPNSREALVILKGGTAENGAPGVIPETAPGLPGVLLSPLDAGTIQRLAPPPAAATPAAVQPAAPGPTNPGAAAAAARTPPRLTPEQQRKRQQDLGACRQRAAKDFPAGAALTKALADCNKILQQQ
jgi:hypothetical protein